jgi:hypothetical protein
MSELVLAVLNGCLFVSCYWAGQWAMRRAFAYGLRRMQEDNAERWVQVTVYEWRPADSRVDVRQPAEWKDLN